MTYHVLITGSTGMVGKGVLLECLDSPHISKVTVLNRHTAGIVHPKWNEILLNDFTQIDSVKDRIGAVDACFHCMGVSSVGMSEADFTRLTFDVTRSIADTLYALNPRMVFVYVSGSGTDSTEQGRTMWARVKGRAENYVLNKGFARAVMFRPGVIVPEKGIESRTNWYNALYVLTTPFFPLLKRIKSITTTSRLGQAMIRTIMAPEVKSHLENRDINELAATA